MSLFGLAKHSGEFRRRLESIQGRLHRMACAWCHDPALASDMAQEASSKALERSGQLRDPDHFDSWMFRILANCCRDHYRKRREVIDLKAVERQVENWTPEDEQGRSEIISAVRSAIASLPPEHRYVLTLVDLEGFSYDQVAKTLEIPIGTVMSRLSRARHGLRDRLRTLGCQSMKGAPVIRRVK